MTDRLISADKLFGSRPEWLNENMEDKEKSAYNKGWNACNNEWCNMVKEQPTAYNLESVLSELEKLTDDASMRCDMYDDHCDYEWGEYNAHKEDLDIVRKGGIQND